MFLYRLVLPYLAIYTMALGATGTQLGIVNSVGMGVAAISGFLSGGLIDRIGVKKIYLLGIVILAASYLIYGLAGSWPILIVAMVAYWLGNNTAILGCSVVCANCLKSEERATGMSICETFGMGLLSLAAPMLGAWIVTAFGGVNVQGIRPLFFVCAAGVGSHFFSYLHSYLTAAWKNTGRAGLSFFQGFSQVFKEGRNLKRMAYYCLFNWYGDGYGYSLYSALCQSVQRGRPVCAGSNGHGRCSGTPRAWDSFWQVIR